MLVQSTIQHATIAEDYHIMSIYDAHDIAKLPM